MNVCLHHKDLVDKKNAIYYMANIKRGMKMDFCFHQKQIICKLLNILSIYSTLAPTFSYIDYNHI